LAKHLYDGYVVTLADRFLEALAEIQAQYNFDYGPEFEVAICKVLRRALPQRFGICRGFVVAASGEMAGDDIIIYDRARFPTLRLLQDEDYALKERIPIEAAYAYIEAKHTLEIEGDSNVSFKHTTEQISRVKQLCATREGVEHPEDWSDEDYPPILNPMFGMILARHVRPKPNKDRLTDPEEIRQLLSKATYSVPRLFDAAILGPDVTLLPVLPNGQEGLRLGSPFFINGKSMLIHQLCVGRSFGVGLSMLLSVLDWIQLGKMPWGRIISDAISPSL
jgi:Domain of unknown function (DUF6602)